MCASPAARPTCSRAPPSAPTNAQIAATLSLKEVTVKSYLQAAMAKLDASTRHAAVAKARRAGLLP